MRCEGINVDLITGKKDSNLPALLEKNFPQVFSANDSLACIQAGTCLTRAHIKLTFSSHPSSIASDPPSPLVQHGPYLGVYAQVIGAGEITCGDGVRHCTC